jgi:hypothetical protein
MNNSSTISNDSLFSSTATTTPKHETVTSPPVSEHTPLLSNTSYQNPSIATYLRIPHHPTPMTMWKEYTVRGVAIVTFVWSLWSLVLWPILLYPTVGLASLVGMALAPYVILQQSQLSQLDALEHVNAQLSNDVNQVQQDNEALSEQVQNLEYHVQE